MPEMPAVARALVTSPPYQLIARRVVLPWVLQGEHPGGEGLEIGAGSGAMTAQLLTAFPRLKAAAMISAVSVERGPGQRSSGAVEAAVRQPESSSHPGQIAGHVLVHAAVIPPGVAAAGYLS